MGRNASTRAPVYQVDFTAQGSGKHIGMSKKKVVFKFGYANEQALADGAVGVEARGQEHEVVCIWSVASGKRQIFVDGQPVHHSTTDLKKRFILSFPFMNHHVMKMSVHATPPLASSKNGLKQRQYDLTLDGQSFFEFARLFELGRGSSNTRTAGNGTALVARSNSGSNNNGGAQYTNYALDENERSSTGSPRGVSSYESEYYGQDGPSSPAFARSPSADQEDADMKAAIEASLREEQARTSQAGPALAIEAPVSSGDADLLDFSSDNLEAPPVPILMAPGPLQAIAAPAPVYRDTFQPVAAAQQAAPAYYEPQQSMNAPAYAPHDSFAPQDNFAPQDSAYQNFQHQQKTFDIMNQYNVEVVAPPAPQAPVSAQMAEMNLEDCTDVIAVPKAPAPVKLSMNTSIYDNVDENADEVTKATSMLCNLDSLNQESKAGIVQKNKAEQQRNATVVRTVDKKGNKVVKSKGLPPKNAAGNPGNMTMQQMQAIKEQQQQGQPQRQVMQSYAGNPGAHSTQMVMHGQPAPGPQYQQQPYQQQQQQQRMPANGGYANYAY